MTQRSGRYPASSSGSTGSSGSIPIGLRHRWVRREPTWSLSVSLGYGCAPPLPAFDGGLGFDRTRSEISSPEAKAAAQDRSLKSLRVQLRFPALGCCQATDNESERPLFPTESCQSSCTFVVRLVVQNAAPTAEYPPDVPVKVGPGWEKHSGDSRDRCETACPVSFLPGHNPSRPQCAHLLSVSACFPGAQIPAPARDGGALPATRAEYRRFHPGTASLDVPPPAGRSSVRLRR